MNLIKARVQIQKVQKVLEWSCSQDGCFCIRDGLAEQGMSRKQFNAVIKALGCSRGGGKQDAG